MTSRDEWIEEQATASYGDKPSLARELYVLDLNNAMAFADAHPELPSICLVCGADKPCMTEADLKTGDPGIPCTFDPTPQELFNITLQYKRRAQVAEAALKELPTPDLVAALDYIANFMGGRYRTDSERVMANKALAALAAKEEELDEYKYIYKAAGEHRQQLMDRNDKLQVELAVMTENRDALFNQLRETEAELVRWKLDCEALIKFGLAAVENPGEKPLALNFQSIARFVTEKLKACIQPSRGEQG